MPLYRGSRRLLLRRNAAIGPFTPASLSGLKGWWKADAGVYTDAGTTLATNGQSVQQWNDQSGNGNHFVQATAGNKPTFVTNSLNSLPAVVGGATPYMVKTSFALGGTTVSTYVVVKFGISASGRILDYGTPNDFDAGGFIGPYFTSNVTPTMHNNGTNVSTSTVTASTWNEVFCVWDGVNGTLYVANVAGTPGASTPTFGAAGTLNIFADASGASNSDSALIAEIVITSNASATDRSNMRTYLLNKWGV